MTGTGRRGDHVRDKLVACATLCLQNPHAFIRIEACILATVTEVDEVGRGVIKKAVRIRLDLEVLNQPEGLALENPDVAIEARDIQFVEFTAEKQCVLSIFEPGDTL
jgi:hypothetical protein